MIDQLKKLLKNREEDNIINLIIEHPEVLDEQDESGSSGILLLAYNGLATAFEKAKDLKSKFTFHEAIVCGKMDTVKADITADETLVNVYSNDGFTPLSLAAFFDQTEIAKVLLEQRANPELQATNPSKVNALHSAVAKGNYELCELLVATGMDLNLGQTQQVTALHSAAHRGNLKMVQLLVENGADIHARMENGSTPLDLAKKDGHHEVINYLDGRTD
ncbi:ankyrin repeat domain-containing protein [Flagellimonas beolgyonensis]|uniref:ankyrin repeat domain-containing protein n=1 Tax=Flagellimonas beolgyonensis TaxID=864064 RepID=UPI003D65D6F6